MTITSVAESDLGDPRILKVAEFAVAYHNRDNFSVPVHLTGVHKAAFEYLESGCMVYFLSLHIQLQSSDYMEKTTPPFTTAVACLPPLLEPSFCVGFIGLEVYLMEEGEGDDTSCQINSEEELHVAKLVVKHQTIKDPLHSLKLEKVLECLISSWNDYLYHRLTLLVRENDQHSKLITTLATTSSTWGDELFEFTPPITIAIHPYPEWISLDLLAHVKALGVDRCWVFSKNIHDSSMFFINSKSIRDLLEFSTHLYPKVLRKELIVFLSQDADQVDPELLSLIATNFAKLIPCLEDKDTHVLLSSLIDICRLGSHIVRASVKSFEQIIAKTKENYAELLFVPFVLELACSDHPANRISSFSLFHIAYEIAPFRFRQVYERLCHDPLLAVRTALVSSLSKVAAACTSDLEYIQKLHQRLALDEHQDVRRLAAKEFTSLMSFFQDKNSFYAVIQSFSRDSDHSVRALVPDVLYEYHANIVSLEPLFIVSFLEGLLIDTAAIVREAVAKSLLKWSNFLILGLEVMQILPFIEMLSGDSSYCLRAVSGWLIMRVISSHGKVFHPLYVILMKLANDEDSCVVLNVVSGAVGLIELLDREILMTAYARLGQHKSDVAKLGLMVYAFVSETPQFCKPYLNDENTMVRKAAKKSIKISEALTQLDGNVLSIGRFKEALGLVDHLCLPWDMKKLITYINQARS